MKCNDMWELLSGYIDGELDEVQKREADEHLEKCGQCRREYNDLLSIAALLREIPDVPLPETFDADLRAALMKEKAIKTVSSKRKWKMLSSIAAVFVIGIFSVTMYNQIGASVPGDGGAEVYMAPDVLNERIMLDNVDAEETLDESTGAEYAEADEQAELGQAARHEMNVISRRNMLDEAAKTEIDYYLILLDELLDNLDFQVIDYLRDEDGVWSIQVEIYTVDEYNQSYTEKNIYSGQDGKLWIKELSSSTETVY